MKKKFVAMAVLCAMLITTLFPGFCFADAATGAKWIWDDETFASTTRVVEPDGAAVPATPANTWMAFRKTVTLDSAPSESVTARIAADSKYWLYINDQLVVFEGSLKRGPNWTDTYVDNVQIGQYLKAGENTIAVLVYYYGKENSFSGRDSGNGGLFFEAAGDGVSIVSDQSWKVKWLKEYGTAQADHQPNYRLSETAVKYDAQIATDGWQYAGFDDSEWLNATEHGSEGDAPWYDFYDRPIPLFKFDEQYNIFSESDITVEQIGGTTTALDRIEADEYVLETAFQVTGGAFGVIFGYQDENNYDAWQILCSTKSNPTPNPDHPVLRPHERQNGGWNFTAVVGPIENVSRDEMNDITYNMKIVVEGGYATTYINDAQVADPIKVAFGAGAVGFRCDQGNSPEEAAYIEYIKVTSLDGETVYLDDQFDGQMNFRYGTLADGKLYFDGKDGTCSVSVIGESAARYVCDMPTNFQFTPYIKVNAKEAGQLIHIYTDTTRTNEVERGMSGDYVTRAGEQEFELLTWLNGDKLYFEVPAGVEVLELGYRRSGYDADFTGYFNSNDEFLNTLWTKSRDTLYVTMRDNYMDCPDRERAQWWGDAVNEVQMSAYALSPSATDLFKKGMQQMFGFVKDDVLTTVPPIGNSRYYELPAQSMAGVMSFWMYYMYTGDDSLLPEAFEKSYNYLMLFTMNANGVVNHRQGSWDWADWGTGADMNMISNCWYYIAAGSALQMAAELGIDDERTAELKTRQDSIRDNFDKVFWNESLNAYRSSTHTVTDDRANALAVFAGLVPQSRYPAVRQVLNTVYQASPYMEKYVLEALYMMGYDDDAVARMKYRYADMVNSDISTLWEQWELGSGVTQNHAWSGGPLTMLGMYAAGVKPLEPGYKKFEITPQLGGLTSIDTLVPSAAGNIELSIIDTEDDFTIDTTVPEGTTAVVRLPIKGGQFASSITFNDEVIWQNGSPVSETGPVCVDFDGEYVYFETNEGGVFKSLNAGAVTLYLDVDDRDNVGAYVNGQRVSLPYECMYAEGQVVDVAFTSISYFGEYGVTSLDGIELEDETKQIYSITMDADLSIMANTDYVGPEPIGATIKSVNHNYRDNDEPVWGANNLVDGIRTSDGTAKGFSTVAFSDPDLTYQLGGGQIIELELESQSLVDRIYLYPRTDTVTDDGSMAHFPKDFTVSVSTNGLTYRRVLTVTDETAPTQPLRKEYKLDEPVMAKYIRIVTTECGDPSYDEAGEIYRVQLSEIEVYGVGGLSIEAAAAAVTNIPAPQKEDAAITMPQLPDGYTASIKWTENTDIIALDGSITLPENETKVGVVLTITEVASGESARTEIIPVIIPAATPTEIEIISQPQDITVNEGESAVFTIEASGSYLHYQWQKQDGESWVDIQDAILSEYKTNELSTDDSGSVYRCVVSNNGGSVISDEAVLTVKEAEPTDPDNPDPDNPDNPDPDNPPEDQSLIIIENASGPSGGVYTIDAGENDSIELNIQLNTAESFKVFANPGCTVEVEPDVQIALEQKTTRVYIRAYFTDGGYEQYTLEILSEQEVVSYSDQDSIPGWANPYISYLNEGGYGIFVGDDNNKFNPAANISRYEIAVLATKLMGIDPAMFTGFELDYDDTIAGWAAPYVKVVSALGVMSGSDDGGKINFGGAKETQRQQFARVMVECILLLSASDKTASDIYNESKADIDKAYAELGFKDEDSVQGWAKPYVRLATVEYTLISGDDAGDGNLYIKGNAAIKRQEVAVILSKYLGFGQ